MNDATQPGMNCRRSMISSALRPSAVVGMASVALTLLVVGPAKAQAPDRPTIVIAATITAESATQIFFPIRVGPASSIPRSSFVRVRGLPSMAALSEGYSIGSGSWAVPLGALPQLKITLPVSAVGKTDVYVTLVGVDGAVLGEARSTLVIVAPPPASARAQPEAPAAVVGPITGAIARSQPLQAAPPVMLPEDRERALKLLTKGDAQLAEGLVAPARLLYERAAELGLAQAAMALAATFDAAELTRPNLRGIQPDAKEAKRWYERARVLGARDADQRLGRLDAN